LAKRARRNPQPNSTTSDSTPIVAISGLACATLCGISATSPSGVVALGVTPSATCVCLLTMITPIAASMPCTTDGEMAMPTVASRSSAKTIWMAAATTPTAQARW